MKYDYEIAEMIIQDFCNRQQNLIEREVSDYIDKNFANVRDITLGDKNCVRV